MSVPRGHSNPRYICHIVPIIIQTAIFRIVNHPDANARVASLIDYLSQLDNSTVHKGR